MPEMRVKGKSAQVIGAIKVDSMDFFVLITPMLNHSTSSMALHNESKPVVESVSMTGDAALDLRLRLQELEEMVDSFRRRYETVFDEGNRRQSNGAFVTAKREMRTLLLRLIKTETEQWARVWEESGASLRDISHAVNMPPYDVHAFRKIDDRAKCRFLVVYDRIEDEEGAEAAKKYLKRHRLEYSQIENWRQRFGLPYRPRREPEKTELTVPSVDEAKAYQIPPYDEGTHRSFTDQGKMCILVLLAWIEHEQGQAGVKAFLRKHHLSRLIIRNWRKKLGMPKPSAHWKD